MFIAGDYAYKVKKPVNFGFLDFSSLEKRKHFCEEEVRLNRRLAPDLYLGVLPIRATSQGPRVGASEGEVLEWCVLMRRFAEEDVLAARLEKGRFDPAWVDVLAQDLARFHMQAERAPQGFGEPQALAEYVLDNLREAARHPDAVSRELVASLFAWAEKELAAKAPLVQKRVQEGCVRACHGDLHLGNIVLWRGRPVPFDCIEFNDAFRFIDIANDIAFLAMDLDARGRTDLALRLLSRWLETSGDRAALALLRLFLFYRAGVRGKVALLTRAGAALTEAERENKAEEARMYFALAARYAAPARPRLYAVAGFSGSGKSTLALQGIAHAKALVFRSDAVRKRLARKYPDEPLYGPAMHERTYQELFALAEDALRAGFSVILDATFLLPRSREDLRALARRLNVPLRIIWLDVPEEELVRRIQARRGDVSDADVEVLRRQLAQHAPPARDEADVLFWQDSYTWPQAAEEA